MTVHSYTVAMTCGGCSGAITRILTKQLGDGEKFDVSYFSIILSNAPCAFKVLVVHGIVVNERYAQNLISA